MAKSVTAVNGSSGKKVVVPPGTHLELPPPSKSERLSRSARDMAEMSILILEGKSLAHLTLIKSW